MSRNNYSFNGDLFPPTSPERKRHRANAEKGSSRSGNARPNRTLLSKGVIYHTREEFVKGQELAQQHPDTYWMKRAPIHLINKRNTLELYKTLNVADVKVNNETGWGYGGHVCGLCISQDGELLAGASIVGSCFIWDSMEWNVIQMLRDPNEPEIEELYRVLFSSDSRSVFTCGKLKSRSTWSEEDGDNFCIPGKIKIYDILSGKVLLQLEGHQEEILCMKIVSFKNSEYLLTGGQDGRIIKWTLTDDYSSYSKVYMDDMTTHYVCSLNILPNCGSKYFVAGCDEGIKVFDFETHVLVDSFPDLYSSYCDVVKVVLVPLIPTEPHETLLVTRGVELIDKTTGKQTRTNKCHLWKLCGPTQATPNFILEPIRIFEHADYHANTWLMNIAVTTRYLLAPTTTGKIFVWNLFSGQLVSIIATHSNCVRDIVFHPTRKQLITCGDDNVVQIFQQNTSESDEEEEEEEEEEDEELSESSSENEMEVETNNDNKLSPHILNIPSSISFAKQSKDTNKGSNINLDSPANGSQPGESAELSSSGESDSEGGESDSSSERYD